MKNFKLKFKKRPDVVDKLNFDNRPRPDFLVSEVGGNISDQKDPHFMFNLLLGASGVRIVGDRSGNHYMHDRCKFSQGDSRKCAHLEDLKKAYYNEIVFRYDWLVEGRSLQEFLCNPSIMENRFIDLAYDEIRRKGFRIVSRRLRRDGDFRRFKQQQVEYSLSHVSLPFPSGSVLVNAKPQDIVIRLDQKNNYIRLDGPGCDQHWWRFTSNR